MVIPLAELLDGYAIDPATGDPVAVPPVVRVRAAAEIVKAAGAAAPQEIDLALSASPRPDLDEAITAAMRSRGLLPPETT